ncbi:MAG: NAD(P)/FAD-dependent oxidoreductase, partial [Pseudomonadota bacterium]
MTDQAAAKETATKETATKETATKETPVDEQWIRTALAKADMNVLRVVLYQHTADPELKAMEVNLRGAPGNPYEIYGVSKEDRETIVDKGVAYLLNPDRPVKMDLNEAEVRELIEMFEGKVVSDSASVAGYEELAFDGFKRRAQWPNGVRPAAADDFEVLIVGAGFSAIVAAIQLDSLGINYRIVERQADFGGTWCLNTYPDARVDITTFIYNFTFEMNYPWRHAFAPREELNEYTAFLVDKYSLRDRAQFATKVVDAEWQEDTAMWHVVIEGPDGKLETLNPNVVLSAAGLFSTPKLPDIEGIERYQGKMFHTTAWDHDYDYGGKRVALIGTGSTGSQLLPKVAPEVEHITVYQRTPNWVTPVASYRSPIIEERKWLLANLPAYANWNRYSFVDASVRAQCFQDLDHDWRAQGGKINEKNDQLRAMLTNMVETKMAPKPELIPHLIPDFAPLSRRIVVDNGFYDALLRDNVELETQGISHITEKGIVGNDGIEREFDLIILAAGFEVERYLYPVAYKG